MKHKMKEWSLSGENINLKNKKLMQQDISNPELYGDLVYKFKKMTGNPNFSDVFKRLPM